MSECKKCGGTKRPDGGCNLCEMFAHAAPSNGTPTTGWPMRSLALAVHPKQVEQANARNKRHGVNVRYEPDGTAVIPDRGEFRGILKLEGMHDNNSFTGY